MKRTFTKLFLPLVALSMIMGTAGLRETICGLYADSANDFYKPHDNKGDALVKVFVRKQEPDEVRLPNFTFFIPGFGTHEGAWSNNLLYTPIGSNNPYCQTGEKEFCYNPDSVVARIENKTPSNVFVAMRSETDDTKFTLYHYPEIRDSENTNVIVGYGEKQAVNNIYSIDPHATKHNIVVFSSSHPKQSNALEFDSFERIANRLCYDFNLKQGYLPQVNLIGHSRGGIIAQEYANNYPFNVYSINTIATPFLGSDTGRLLQRLGSFRYPLLGWIFNLIGNEFLWHDGFTDLQNISEANARKTAWNEVRQDAKIKAAAYGSVMTLPFIAEDIVLSSIWSNCAFLNTLPLTLATYLADAFTTINNHNVTSSGTTDFTALMDYSTFENDCYSIDVNHAKNTLKNKLRPLMYGAVTVANPGFPALLLVDPASQTTAIEIERIIDDVANTFAKAIVCYKHQVCVLRDDFLVGLDSQMCKGYSYYKRFVKVFDTDYLDFDNGFFITDPNFLVGHNMETMNKQITSSIIDRGMFSNKSEVEDDIFLNHQWPVMERHGSVNCNLNQMNLEIHDGHGQCWGEFHADIPVTGVPQNDLDTIWVDDYDNHTNAEFFYYVISYNGSGTIQIVLYTRPQYFYSAEGFVTINFTFESEMTLDYIEITEEPNKTDFYLGEEIDYEGLEVKAFYTSGVVKTLSEIDYSISFDEDVYTTPGTYIVTITYVEKFEAISQIFKIIRTHEYLINIREPQLVSLSLNYENCQTNFHTAESFDSDGLIVFANYENGDSEQVTSFYVDPDSVNMSVAGVYHVNVYYGVNGATQSASYDVTVEELVLDSITLSGYQTEFDVDDEFDVGDLVVTAHYTNGFSREVTDYTVVTRNINMAMAGEYNVKVRYTENDVTVNTTYQITVVYHGPSLTGITLSGDYQTSFQVGESFNHNGLIVTAHYDDGTSRVVSGYSVMPLSYDPYGPGTYNVVVNYSDNGGFAITSYSVTVEFLFTPVFLESITLSGNYRTNFRMGQTLDFTGLIVTANYTDGSYEEVTNYTIDTSDVNVFFPGTYQVRVLYTFKGVTAVAIITIRISRFIKDTDLPTLPDDPIKPFPGKF